MRKEMTALVFVLVGGRGESVVGEEGRSVRESGFEKRNTKGKEEGRRRGSVSSTEWVSLSLSSSSLPPSKQNSPIDPPPPPSSPNDQVPIPSLLPPKPPPTQATPSSRSPTESSPASSISLFVPSRRRDLSKRTKCWRLGRSRTYGR